MPSLVFHQTNIPLFIVMVLRLTDQFYEKWYNWNVEIIVYRCNYYQLARLYRLIYNIFFSLAL
jgi:hypothetical protein